MCCCLESISFFSPYIFKPQTFHCAPFVLSKWKNLTQSYQTRGISMIENHYRTLLLCLVFELKWNCFFFFAFYLYVFSYIHVIIAEFFFLLCCVAIYPSEILHTCRNPMLLLFFSSLQSNAMCEQSNNETEKKPNK